MGLFTERDDQEFNADDLRERFKQLEEQFKALASSNDAHKDDMADTKKRVDALESKVKRLIPQSDD